MCIRCKVQGIVNISLTWSSVKQSCCRSSAKPFVIDNSELQPLRHIKCGDFECIFNQSHVHCPEAVNTHLAHHQGINAENSL